MVSTNYNNGPLFSWPPCIITNRSLKRSWYHTPRGLLGAWQQGQEGDKQRQDRVARDDDGVGGHARGARVPKQHDNYTLCYVLFSNKQLVLVLGHCHYGRKGSGFKLIINAPKCIYDTHFTLLFVILSEILELNKFTQFG